MRYVPEFNFPAFIAKTAELRAVGHQVFNPAERDLENGFDPTGLKGTDEELRQHGFDLREALAVDLSFICREATHLYMLPGWSRSSGARAEWSTALALGLTIEGAAS